MNKRSKFTLVELLVVIGIIAILAGLILGAVSLSQSSARNTQAKSDMASIILALRGVETTYGKLAVSSKSGSNNVYKYDGFEAVVLNTSDTGDFIYLGQPKKADHSEDDTDSEKAYDALIAELSVPKNNELLGEGKLNVNKRRMVFLEPKSDFNPAEKYNSDDNKSKLWRDPWGHRYMVFINVSGTKHLQIPEVQDKALALGSNSFNVATDVAIYSHGPNGVDNGGCHADLDTCINHADRSNHKFHDDIASWRK